MAAPRTFYQEVARGNVTGASPIHVMGYNGDVDEVEEDLWPAGGTYTFPAAAGTAMECVSSSTSDATGGVGAMTIEIHYLDANLAEQVEVLACDGTTATPTLATNIRRIQDIHVKTAGTSLTSVGNISIRAVGDTPVYGYITAGQGTGRRAAYTVPAGKTAFIESWHGSGGNVTGNRFVVFQLKATQDIDSGYTGGIFHTYDTMAVQDGGMQLQISIPAKFIAGTDIKITARGDASNASAICAGGFDGWTE